MQLYLHPLNGPVAQLDSASDYESEGYRFESCQGHIYKTQLPNNKGVAFFYTATFPLCSPETI